MRRGVFGGVAKRIQSNVDGHGDTDNVSWSSFSLAPGELVGAWCLLIGGTFLVKSRR